MIGSNSAVFSSSVSSSRALQRSKQDEFLAQMVEMLLLAFCSFEQHTALLHFTPRYVCTSSIVSRFEGFQILLAWFFSLYQVSLIRPVQLCICSCAIDPDIIFLILNGCLTPA